MNEKILIVDDKHEIAGIAEMCLSAEGFKLTSSMTRKQFVCTAEGSLRKVRTR